MTRQFHRAIWSCTMPLFLILLFALTAHACGGWLEPKEKLIGIHLDHHNARVGVIQNGQVAILSGDSDGEVISISMRLLDGVLYTEDGSTTEGELLSQDIYRMAMAASQQRAQTQGLFAQTPLNGIPSPQAPKVPVPENITIQENGTEYTIPPSQIYAPILSRSLTLASSHIGPNITGAVLTIPSFFTETDREHIKRAGERIGLPIVRQMHESTAVLVSLGLDELSYEGDRYVLYMDFGIGIEDGSVEMAVIEIDTGIVERLATVSVDMKTLSNSDETDTDENAIGMKPRLAPVLEDLLLNATSALNATLTTSNISDLVILDRNQPPRYNFHKNLKEYFPTARIANTPSLQNAGIHGATHVAGILSGEGRDEWIPCCCSTSRPPVFVRLEGIQTQGQEHSRDESDPGVWDNGAGIGNNNSTLGVLTLLEQCLSLPAYGSNTLLIPCGDTNVNVKVYMQDLPCIDYHAMYEMGDLYVPETAIGEVFLGEFPLARNCADGEILTRIGVAAVMDRRRGLSVQVRNLGTGEEGVVDLEETHFECGEQERYGERGYTYVNNTWLKGGLEEMYQAELGRFVGLSRDQKAVDAFADVN
ncbi:Hsp70 protein-domain-containing protein [Aspergillus crustosus]